MLVIRRPRYACRACGDAIVQAPTLARLIESGLPTDALIAQVLVSKYADRLPLYRQAQIFARQGVSLDRSTLADWAGRAAFLLRPVHERLLETLVHGQAVCRRDHGTGARAGPRRHQDRPALGVCARRPALGRDGSARRRLRVRARPHSRTTDRASLRVCRRAAGRRLGGLREPGQGRRGAAGLLLEPCASAIL